jgi:periplasmic protein TonB
MTSSIVHRNLASPRITALAGILALHVLIAYLLLTALVQRPGEEGPPPITLAPIERVPAPPVPTPPIQPGATSKGPQPRPDFQDLRFTPPTPPEAPAPRNAVGPGEPTGGSSPLPPIRVLGRHWLPSSEAYYPAALIREGVQGDSLVRVCVDEAGRLSGAPVLERSSGNARLDQGALEVTRAGRYARAVRGDTPVPNCYVFHVVFTMK